MRFLDPKQHLNGRQSLMSHSKYEFFQSFLTEGDFSHSALARCISVSLSARALAPIQIVVQREKMHKYEFFQNFLTKGYFSPQRFSALFLFILKRQNFGAHSNVVQCQKLDQYEFFQNCLTEDDFPISQCGHLCFLKIQPTAYTAKTRRGPRRPTNLQNF